MAKIRVPLYKTPGKSAVIDTETGAVAKTTSKAAATTTPTVTQPNTSVHAVLSNPIATIATNPDGTGGDFASAVGTCYVFNGAEDVTGLNDAVNGPVYSLSSATAGLTASIDPITGAYSASLDDTHDTGEADFKVVYGSTVMHPAFTVVKNKNGKSVIIRADGAGFTYQNGSPSPTSQTVTLIAKTTNMTGNVTWSSSPNVTLGITGDTATLSASDFDAAGADQVTISATLGGITDYLVLVRLTPTATTNITGDLTNPVETIATNADGTGGSYGQAGGTFLMWDSDVDVTRSTDVAYSVASADSGLSISIDSTDTTGATRGDYTVSGLTVSSAKAVLQATYHGVTVQKAYTIKKNLSGQDLTLTADGYSFDFQSGQLIGGQPNITVTAALTNLTGTINWTTSPAGVTLTGTGNSRVLTGANFAAAGAKEVVVKATLGGVSDEVNIVKLTTTASPPEATPGNVLNPGFEAGDTGWDKNGWAIVEDAANSGHGSWYATITGSANVIVNQNRVPVDAGWTIRPHCRFKTASGASGNGYVGVRFYKADGTAIRPDYFTDATHLNKWVTGPSTTYDAAHIHVIAPTGAAFASLAAYVYNCAGQWYLDDCGMVMLPFHLGEVGDDPTPGGRGGINTGYIDGNNRLWKTYRKTTGVDVDVEDFSKHAEVTQHIGGKGISTLDLATGKILNRNLSNIADDPATGGRGGIHKGYIDSNNRPNLLRRASSDISPDDASLHSEVTSHIGGLNTPNLDFGGAKITNRLAQHLNYADGSTAESLQPGEAGAVKSWSKVADDTGGKAVVEASGKHSALWDMSAIPPGFQIGNAGATFSIVSGVGVTGGDVLEAVNHCAWYGGSTPVPGRGQPVYPYDPTKLYRIRARLRVTTDDPTGTQQGQYMGVQMIDASGAGAGANSGLFYFISNVKPVAADGWQEYEWWMTGNNASANNRYTGTPTNPASPINTAVAFSPVLLINYQSGSDGQVTQVDSYQIDVFDADGHVRTYSGLASTGDVARNVPDAHITQTAVTQHQNAITAGDVQVGSGKAVLEKGANVTETRVSADTSRVGGQLSATVAASCIYSTLWDMHTVIPGWSGPSQIVSGPGVTGGNVLQVAGNAMLQHSSDGNVPSYPYDPGKLYRIRCRLRVTVDDSSSQQVQYVGIQTLNSTYGGIGGNGGRFYLAASAAKPTASMGWQEYEAWFTGTASGNTGFKGTPDNPCHPITGTAYFAPELLINYQSPNGQVTQVDFFSIDVYDADAQNRTYRGFNPNGRINKGTNLITLNSGGYATSYWSGITFSPGIHYMNISAGVSHIGAETTSYHSSSISGLSAATTYSFYYKDADYAGGTQTLYAAQGGTGNATAVQTLIGNDANRYIGDGTTKNASGGGGGGGTAACLALDMFLRPYVPAVMAREGQKIDGVEKFAHIGERRLLNAWTTCGPAVRITTANGSVLDCGEDTPFDLKDGTSKLAKDMQGETVLTDAGEDTVASVEPLGAIPLMYVSAGGISFMAGKDATKRIASHNTVKP